MEGSEVLRVESLGVRWPGRAEPVLRDVALSLARGECVGLAGRSGAGKSTLALALMRLLPERAQVDPATRIMLGNEALHSLPEPEMAKRRGRRIGMVFQEPALALHPAMRIGELIAEGLAVHGIAEGVEAEARVEEMLARVGVPDARLATRRYAHEFSGGMRQRILLASALVMEPDVLIVDEPTTALDMTIQAQVLDLLDELRAERGTAMIHISHDLAVLGERADRVLELREGRLVAGDGRGQRAPSGQGRVVGVGRKADGGLLDAEALVVSYGAAEVARGVSISIAPGEAVGLVGESGSGKTSVAHAIMRLVDAEGSVKLGDVDVLGLRGEALRRFRARIQLVPQDAGASLTPHLPVETLIAEGMVAHELAGWDEARQEARALLAKVGLAPELAAALPTELSAGQRQRVAIARALAVRPTLLICDEPVSVLDPESRSVVLDLLSVMQREHSVSLLIITHDLESVMRITTRVAVMYAGRVVETGPTDEVLSAPRMPYTRALLDAIPTGVRGAARGRRALGGEPPSPLSPPSGCAFHPRCPHPAKDAQCMRAVPALAGDDVRRVACLKQ